MKYAEIKETFLDYPDNESLSIIIYFTGCSWACLFCQNKELQDINSGKFISVEDLAIKIKTYAKRVGTDKIVFSGGDPFYQYEELVELLNLLEDFDICVYTGYSIEEVTGFLEAFNCKKPPLYIKCGAYREDLRDPNMGKTDSQFVLASKNQAFFKWDGLRKLYYQISEGNVLKFNE